MIQLQWYGRGEGEERERRGKGERESGGGRREEEIINKGLNFSVKLSIIMYMCKQICTHMYG